MNVNPVFSALNGRETPTMDPSFALGLVLGKPLIRVDQDRMHIDIGACKKREKLNFYQLLIMPFTKPVLRYSLFLVRYSAVLFSIFLISNFFLFLKRLFSKMETEVQE